MYTLRKRENLQIKIFTTGAYFREKHIFINNKTQISGTRAGQTETIQTQMV